MQFIFKEHNINEHNILYAYSQSKLIVIFPEQRQAHNATKYILAKQIHSQQCKQN